MNHPIEYTFRAQARVKSREYFDLFKRFLMKVHGRSFSDWLRIKMETEIKKNKEVWESLGGEREKESDVEEKPLD